MKRVLIALTAIAIAVFSSVNAYSQSSFFFHAGPAFPISDFGNDDVDEDDAGGANVGLNLGGKYVYPLNNNGLGLFIGADLNYNGLKGSVKDYFEDQYSYLGVDDEDITYYKYVNVPVTAGLSGTYAGNGQVSVFGEVGIGVDFLKITDMTIEVNNKDMVTNFDVSAQLAYVIGGGVWINDKVGIGLHYNNLGKHEIDGEMKYAGYTEDLESSDLKVGLVTLTLGVKL